MIRSNGQQLDAAYRQFRVQLVLHTNIEHSAFINWTMENLLPLRTNFMASGRDPGEIAVYLREEYVRVKHFGGTL